jgi:hypothetical protein
MPESCATPCPAEFVQLVASEANTVSEEDKKKTINPEHVVSALQRLGLSPFLEDVNAMWSEVKESEQSRSEWRMQALVLAACMDVKLKAEALAACAQPGSGRTGTLQRKAP